MAKKDDSKKIKDAKKICIFFVYMKNLIYLCNIKNIKNYDSTDYYYKRNFRA